MEKLIILSMIMLATAGCSMEASLEELSAAIKTLKMPAKATGLVSGSTQTGTTTGGGTVYKVQSTVGSYTSGIEQEAKDSNGTTNYKVYSSVQGALVSK